MILINFLPARLLRRVAVADAPYPCETLDPPLSTADVRSTFNTIFTCFDLPVIDLPICFSHLLPLSLTSDVSPLVILPMTDSCFNCTNMT